MGSHRVIPASSEGEFLHPAKLVLDLATSKGIMAELTYMGVRT